MLKKLIMFAITSGIAAKLYKSYAAQKGAGETTAGRTPASRRKGGASGAQT
ncbi:MAG: hypothetical protein JWQ72_4046 [Polaromonas sp.]|nr:hypothetical protein [Polaromonas sp.]